MVGAAAPKSTPSPKSASTPSRPTSAQARKTAGAKSGGDAESHIAQLNEQVCGSKSKLSSNYNIFTIDQYNNRCS